MTETSLRHDHEAGEAVESADSSAGAAPLRVLMVAPSLDMLGGQAVQAARLLERWREDPALDVSLLPINPRLPGPLRKLQTIKYIRTVLTSLYYCATLLTRVRRYDVIHIFSASVQTCDMHSITVALLK